MCECDSVGTFVLQCSGAFLRVKRGMWNWATNTMKYVTENSFCGWMGASFFLTIKGLTTLKFNDLCNGLLFPRVS